MKEIERLNLRIAELENEHRQRPPQEIAKALEKQQPAANSARTIQLSPPTPTELLNDHEVAAFLNMSVASVRRWRVFRTGPKFVKIGSAVRYRRRDVENWLNSCAAGAFDAAELPGEAVCAKEMEDLPALCYEAAIVEPHEQIQ